VASVTSENISGLLNGNKLKEDNEFTIKVIKDGVEKEAKILVAVGETMSDVVKKINDAKDGTNSLGLKAAYDSSLGKLMITTKDQGFQEIAIIADTGSVATSLEDNEKSKYKSGTNAQIKFNGDAIEKSSNSFSIFGVNYQLQAETVGAVTINVESNVNGIMDKVKSFVEDYNALIDNLNSQLKQKSYRDFQPLLKEEKEAMSDNEIELWEEKAKSGLLRNDETVTRVLQTMRNGLYEEAKGVEGFKHLTQLGITTGNYQSGGKLEINEEKLRVAIVDNPDGVVQLLFNTSNIKAQDGQDAKAVAAENRANTGLVNRLFDDMVVGMKEIVRRSGTGDNASLFRNVQSNMLIDFVISGSISVMDRDIMGIGTRIAREERLLMGREDRYWRQFTAMEKALEKMNQQSGWLMAQLGQMG